MDVSVVIVNYNVRYFLEQCILSIQAASKKLALEIIIIDNNSSDDSMKAVKEKFPDVITIENKDNKGLYLKDLMLYFLYEKHSSSIL